MNTATTWQVLDWTAAAAGRAEAGGKGWQLGLLRRYGLPVPEGFVIPASICRRLMDAAGIYARVGEVNDLVLEECRNAVTRESLPAEFVELVRGELDKRGWLANPLAVRSSATSEDSATASFAGIYRSCLNVQGLEQALEAICEVWGSLWTLQAAAYRSRFGVAEREAAMAVVVMPLLPARAAGIAFSCDPASGRDDQIVIHAQWGLGEALVAGDADGDEYRLQENVQDTTLSLVDRRLGSKARCTVTRAGGGTETVDASREAATTQVLSESKAVALGELVRDAAFALDFARPFYDVEWVWDGERFWIVQARPVTAMARNTYAGLAGQPTIWSNGNTRDVVPLPLSAMDWCGSRRVVNAILECGYRHAGYPLLPGAQRAALFNGRLYLNLSMLMWEAWDGFGVAPAVINSMAGGHQPEIAVPKETLRHRLRRLRHIVRYVSRVTPIRRRAQQIAESVLSLAHVWRHEYLPNDAEICRTRLLDHNRMMRSQSDLGLLQGSGGASLAMLVEKLEKFFPGESYSIAASLLAGGEPSVTAQQGYELMEIAALVAKDASLRAWITAQDRNDDEWRRWPDDHPFRQRFARFLARYGHRGVYETYWRQNRWYEEPGYLLDNIAGLLDTDASELRARQERAREEAWQKVRRAVPWWRRIGLEALVKAAANECVQRELARSSLIALTDGCRPLLLHIGRMFAGWGALAQASDIFELTIPEICRMLSGCIPPAGVAARVADRIARRQEWDAHPAPDVILEEPGLPPVAQAAPARAGTDDAVLRGVAVGAGLVRGIARVIHHPADGRRLQKGDILVAPSTDPAWTPLFLKAAGLVMETGGYLSHGAIVAREFAIPAVVNLPGVLAKVRDGDLLEVDGGSGRVRIIEADGAAAA
jgi:pyruvate,water dikinase